MNCSQKSSKFADSHTHTHTTHTLTHTQSKIFLTIYGYYASLACFIFKIDQTQQATPAITTTTAAMAAATLTATPLIIGDVYEK